MFNFVDLILIAIVACFVFVGIKNGFARTLLSFLARIVSLVTAYFVSDMYADVVYEKLFKETVVSSIESYISSGVSGHQGEQIWIALDNLPQKISDIAEVFGIDMLALHGAMDGVDLTGDISSSLEATVAGPIAIAVCRIVIFAIASVVISFVLSIVINLICKVVKLPVLNTADKLLGAGLGLLNGVVCMFILSFIFTIASGLISPSELSDAISSSYIIDFFAYTGMLI